MSDTESGTASATETGSSLAVEEEDWLPEESKKRVHKQQRADYQRVESTCSACE